MRFRHWQMACWGEMPYLFVPKIVQDMRLTCVCACVLAYRVFGARKCNHTQGSSYAMDGFADDANKGHKGLLHRVNYLKRDRSPVGFHRWAP